MDKRKRKSSEVSDYTRLGYVSLHVKAETRQRVNEVIWQMRLSNKVISQDDVLNQLLDKYASDLYRAEQLEAEPA